MKVRHATALALVGWYLMMPPLNNEGKVDTHAPMSRWFHFMSFDSATACRKMLFALSSREATEDEFEQVHAFALKAGHQPPLNREEMTRRMMESLCVAGDNRALMKNER